MHLRTTGTGDHAVGTELVAAPGDADVGGSPSRSGGIRVEGPREIQGLEMILGRGQCPGASRAVALQREPVLPGNDLVAARIVDEHGHAIEFARPAEKVDLRHLRQQACASRSAMHPSTPMMSSRPSSFSRPSSPSRLSALFSACWRTEHVL